MTLMEAARGVPPDFSEYRKHLSLLREAALRAADPAAAVRRHLTRADAEGAGRIFVVGAGKAGVAMASAAEEVLGERITAGAVSVPALPGRAGGRIKFSPGGHPVPTAGSLSAGEEIAGLLQAAGRDDLVLALLSGGASALVELPRPGIALDDLQSFTRILLQSGASINEFNSLRSRLSLLKSGGLARLAYPARVLGLILSDVVGSPLETIASGPTVFPRNPRGEIDAVLAKYRLRELLPPAILECLDRPSAGGAADFPPDLRVENRVIASNRMAAEAAGAAALRLGFRLDYLADDWRGESRAAGERFALLVKNASGRGPACCLAGGETTVTVRGSGKGGRNQEAALAAAVALRGVRNVALATLATDGVDGPTGAAGAIVTGETVLRAQAAGLDPARHLADNNSYPFFSALGDLILTGPTGTNVNDLWIGLAY
jgi:glycerate 2-kinase